MIGTVCRADRKLGEREGNEIGKGPQGTQDICCATPLYVGALPRVGLHEATSKILTCLTKI